MQDLVPGAARSVAYGISDNGQVAGTQGRAFLYSGGTLQDLGALPGGLDATGTSVNVSGQVTGYSSTSPAFPMPTHAFLYSGGVMQDLGTLGGGKSMGYGINASGHVTGSSVIAGSPVEHAFVYSAGVMKDLGTLGGSNSVGLGINAGGQVTGYSDISGNAARHAFLYSGGTMKDLGTLGGTISTGFGINDLGEVVGDSVASGGVTHAFLYSGGTMYDLNSLVVSGLTGPPLARATGINNVGQVVANDCGPTGIECHVYRLDPITSADIPIMSNWMLGATSVLLLIAGSFGLRRTTRSNGKVVLLRRRTSLR